MTFRVRETPDKIIVFFPDAKFLDDDRNQEIGRGLRDICDRAVSTAKRVIVDFSGILFMSSGTIGELVLLNKAAKQHSLDLRLAKLAPNLLEVFKITRLNKVFRFDDDDPDLIGAGVQNPKPPNTLDGRAEPPSI